MVGNRILRLDNARMTINYLKKNGVSHTFYAAVERIQEERRMRTYCYQAPAAEELARQRQETAPDSSRFSSGVPPVCAPQPHRRCATPHSFSDNL